MIKDISGIMNISLRSIVSVCVLFALTRLMGKKQISQLSFFDYVVGITIGSIAANFAIDPEMPYEYAIISLVIYALFPIVVSFITLNTMAGRRILGGTPTILIQNGKLIEKNLKKSKYNVNDILEECRMKGAFSISDVEFAILETSGQVSVLLKARKQPLTPENMNIKVSGKGLSAELIIDGKIMHEHLALVKHDEKWLLEELNKMNIDSPKEVLLASLDSDGKINIDLKNQDVTPFDVLE